MIALKVVIIIILLAIIVYVYYNPKSNSSQKVKKNLQQARLLEFLEKADEAYILAHQKKNINHFDRFATEEVLRDILNDISYGQERLFGTAKYRIRNWDFIESNEFSWVVRKRLTHQNIRINRSFDIAIGEDVTELWKVKRSGNSYMVVEIMG